MNELAVRDLGAKRKMDGKDWMKESMQAGRAGRLSFPLGSGFGVSVRV